MLKVVAWVKQTTYGANAWIDVHVFDGQDGLIHAETLTLPYTGFGSVFRYEFFGKSEFFSDHCVKYFSNYSGRIKHKYGSLCSVKHFLFRNRIEHYICHLITRFSAIFYAVWR